MKRVLFVLIGWLIASTLAWACSICGGAITNRQTWAEQLRRGDFIAVGTLYQAEFDPHGGQGRTGFRITRVLKAPKELANLTTLSIPRYIPVVGNKPPDYLLCCQLTDGQLDPTFGLETTPARLAYIQGLLKLDDRQPGQLLAHAFAHLDAADDGVANDAFLVLAKAPDAELQQAKALFQPAKLRKLLADPKTPPERLGVLALLLGLCGTPSDVDTLARPLMARELPESIRANLSGYLAGLTLLNRDLGWKWTTHYATLDLNKLDLRLSAISAVRFAQSTRPKEERAAILACYEQLLALPDLADLPIDDLRRWQWWDLSEAIFKLFDQPLYQSTVMRRGIVRYALQCPNPQAKRFLAAVREKDFKLVQEVEELLKAFEPIK